MTATDSRRIVILLTGDERSALARLAECERRMRQQAAVLIRTSLERLGVLSGGKLPSSTTAPDQEVSR